ncbi:unnamed protein product, partial [Mesorhabditis belari]|uniref:Uncharacterized protein n=1 Tax=Mesorhabditis belari TaxID=2138241 RepID=A0AAF3ER18_9BILA
MGEIKKDYGFLDDYCDEVYPVTHFYEKEPLKTSVVLIPYQDRKHC